MARKSKTEGQAHKAFLTRVAKMYYTLEMSQQEIADQLGIGRSSVGRFLKEARDQGVVQIHIGTNMTGIRRTYLEDRLIMKYGLEEVVVYRGSAEESDGGFYGQVGRYMDSLLPVKGKIGLTGGDYR